MKLSTVNLTEVSYLLQRNHRIVGTEIKSGTFGVQELFVILEGRDIDLDHKNFLLSGSVDLKRIPQALQLISSILANGQEETL